jgi:hypothetical protein
MDEALAGKDYFSINDRIIEVQSVPLPKAEKEKIKKRVDEINKKVEESKKGGGAEGDKKDEKKEDAKDGKEGAQPAAAAAEVKGK